MNNKNNYGRNLYCRVQAEINDALMTAIQKSLESFSILDEFDTELLNDENKKTIIELVVSNYESHKNKFRSLASLALLKKFKNDELSINDKWESLLQYCRDANNLHRNLHSIIQMTMIEKLAQLYNKQGEESLEENNFVLADIYFTKAVNIATKTSDRNLSRYYENTVRCLEQAIEQRVYPDFQQRINMRVTKSDYHHRFFGGTFYGVVEPAVKSAGYLFRDLFIVGVIPGIAITALGILLGTIAGVAAIATSKVLGSEELNTVLGILNEISQLDNDGIKEEILRKINSFYESGTFSSEESAGLSANLKKVEISVQERWNMVVKYMTQSMNEYNQDFFRNNGKKLFGVIAYVLSNYKKLELNGTELVSSDEQIENEQLIMRNT